MSTKTRSGIDYERLLAESFRRAHWSVRRQRPGAGLRPDLIVDAGGKTYAVELKRSAEGRRDRLIPLLSQAVLQARAMARELPEAAVPVAVVAAQRISLSVADEVKRFGAQFAPDVGVGVIDSEGLRAFAGHGLEALDARPPRPLRGRQPVLQRLPHLFSDLNSWMLKVLLAGSISESLLSAPRKRFGSATELAGAAGVSVMSASRLVRQLQLEAFLDVDSDHLELVRVDNLLARWIAANQRAFRDIPARWILKREEGQLWAAVRSYSSEPNASAARNRRGAAIRMRPRCAVGLFAAAGALGLGFVRGVPPYIYLERLDLDVIRRFGLSLDNADRRADVFVRVPANREAIFRAAVIRDGLPISDVLQVWLDVSTHPARGREQADEIRKRVVEPLVGKLR